MEKEYYYLDGKDKKGPFTFEELNVIGVKPSTLIWTDENNNWIQAKEMPELVVFFTNIVDEKNEETFNEDVDANEILTPIKIEQKKKERSKFKILSKISTLILLILGLIFLISYFIIKYNKDNYKKDIDAEIERTLNGNTAIIDGLYEPVQGRIENNEFKCEKGGFVIRKLIKVSSNYFKITTCLSQGITFNSKPEIYNPNNNIVYSPQFGLLNIEECYKNANDYFLNDKKDNPVLTKKFEDIKYFKNIQNDYYFLFNDGEWTSVDKSYYLTYQYYKFYCEHKTLNCYLIEKKDAIKIDFYKYLGLGVSILILALIIYYLLNPKFFINLKLFGKMWKYDENSTILSFEHMIFKNHKVNEINKPNVNRGKLKIAQRGKTLKLIFPNTEYYYKIIEISNVKLKVFDLLENKEIYFINVTNEN